MMAQDDLHDATEVQQNMHLAMVPTLGLLFTVVLIAITTVLLFMPKFISYLRYLCVVLAGAQIFFTIFFWFNPVWEIGLQLLVVGAFSLFALLSNNEDDNYMLWYSILSLFNTLALWGKLQFLGYPAATLLDAVAEWQYCPSYYGYSEEKAHCTSYINFLQFLAFILILIQPLQAMFGYLLYRGKGAGSEGKIGGYGAIGGNGTSETS
eukprot:TRINITY_DN51_c0_g1_i1.p1 TRINITY_DN51_c0_g1~~TRINITY_DN51_c0_g1_i1.p1  ORF type:complete len:208 (-),score=32.28 TRINITY_DN51_c0_g1_i1:54-677(-)